MKYVLTGASGYIGSRTLRRLIDDHEVTVILRRPINECEHIADLSEHKNITYVQYTGEYDNNIIDAIKNADHVIHLAALYSTAVDEKTILDLISSNVVFSSHLMLAIKTYNPNASFVTTSTFSAYDNENNYSPKSIYAATKVAMEDLSKAFLDKVAILCLGDTYGPGDWRVKIHNLLNNASKKGDFFEGRSPGYQKINLTHVDDVVTALINLGVFLKKTDGKQFLSYDFFYPENNITLEEIGDILSGEGKFSFPNVGKIDSLPTQKRMINPAVFSPKYTVRNDLYDTLNSTKGTFNV